MVPPEEKPAHRLPTSGGPHIRVFPTRALAGSSIGLHLRGWMVRGEELKGEVDSLQLIGTQHSTAGRHDHSSWRQLRRGRWLRRPRGRWLLGPRGRSLGCRLLDNGVAGLGLGLRSRCWRLRRRCWTDPGSRVLLPPAHVLKLGQLGAHLDVEVARVDHRRHGIIPLRRPAAGRCSAGLEGLLEGEKQPRIEHFCD
jgi:hypothetical protein